MARALPLLVVLAACQSPLMTDSRIPLVEQFSSAHKAGDLVAARAFLAEDPRLWYDRRDGDGEPWALNGGRWFDWDEHFNSTTEAEPWHAQGDIVFADMREMNEYFRLTEAGPGWWRATYFFDDAGKIEGFMVSNAPGRSSDRGRRDEFEEWAFEHEPEEAEYVMPGGRIDPTGDRPQRMRALLRRWRSAVGLPDV